MKVGQEAEEKERSCPVVKFIWWQKFIYELKVGRAAEEKEISLLKEEVSTLKKRWFSLKDLIFLKVKKNKKKSK